MKYELVFEGSSQPGYTFPRYRRYHSNFASVRETVARVRERLDFIHHPTGGSIADCHDPQVYDAKGKFVFGWRDA